MPGTADLPLRAIHLPPDITWWPLAIGWWIALGIVSLALIAVAIALWQLLKPSLKKEAQKALNSIVASYYETDDDHACLAEISKLLRRAVISQNKRLKRGLEGLTGEAWLKILDCQLKQPEFSRGAGHILLTGPYRKIVEKNEVEELIQLCQRWVKTL